MFVYRFAKNPYKPSKWNSGANTLTGVAETDKNFLSALGKFF